MIDALPTGILFLKKITSVEVLRRGTLSRQITRMVDDDRILVADGEDEREWVVVRGDFSAAAVAIRDSFPGKIEPKRGADVMVAVPIGVDLNGLLAQGLPTQQRTGLPFHVNADFFPSSDRKKLIFESDFQGDWNRAALRGAAEAVARALPVLRDALGPVGVWKVVRAGQGGAGGGARNPDPVFSTFWERLVPALAAAEIALGADGRWHRLAEVVRPQQDEEAAATAELEALGLTLLHDDLRPYAFSLPQATGLRTLALGDLTAALRDRGLAGVVSRDEVPQALATPGSLERLWGAIEALLDPKRTSAEARAAIRACAVVPRIGGGLAPPADAMIADHATAALFGAIAPIAFADGDRLAESSTRLLGLCEQFGPSAAIEALESLSRGELVSARRAGRLDPRELLQWFASRQDEVLRDSSLKRRLASLAIIPSGSGLAPLGDLVMVGDFDDPLGLTQFVDLEAVHGLKTFLSDLGVATLNLPTYVQRPPQWVAALAPARRRQILRLLAERLGALRDDEATRREAAKLELADVGAAFIRPGAAYFDTQVVRDVLGPAARLVRLTPGHEEADEGALEWLGARETPRGAHIRARGQALTSTAPDDASAAAIGRILGYIGRQPEGSGLWEGLAALKTLGWLPAIGNRTRWFSPAAIFAGFSASLFESQADFLDVPIPVQQGITNYLEWLGIEFNPSVDQVVRHLRQLIDDGAQVGKNIYLFLNNNASDPGVDALVGTACLKFGDEAYRADEVFWGEHGLAPYAHRLPDEARAYGAFLARLNVKELPDHADALRVLASLAADVGHRPLADAQAELALNCWRLLERALDAGEVDTAVLAGLRDRPSIPSPAGILEHPGWLFFEDRPGLAGKFGPELKAVVIHRVMGASRAMKAAGVRDLGRVVELHVIEQTEPVPGRAVAERISQRSELLARVIEVHARSTEEVDRGLLGELEPTEVRDLLVRYSIPLGWSRADSKAERPSALYTATERRLFYVADGVPPWAAIARELAIALFPSLEPGGPASGFRDVLAADSADVASAILDELSYPRLAPAGQAGNDESPLEPLGSDEPATLQGRGVPAGDGEPGGREEYEPEPPGGEPAPEHGSAGDRAGQAPETGTSLQPRRRPRQSRLRTYVAPTSGESAARQEDEDEAAQRTAIEEAGIARVVEAEKVAGWTPEVMPPFNPGYDLISTSALGEVRLIEVKSTAMEWGALGVGVSHRQFLTSLDEGDRFWLYVVERAEDDEHFQIHRIYDPGRRVDQFMFDDGWRGAHEPYPGREVSDPVDPAEDEEKEP